MSKVHEFRATVSSKGQVVLPADVRRRLGLVQGSVLRFVLDDAGVRLLPPAGDVRRLKGRLPTPSQPVSIEDMAATIAERRSRVARG
ncbi:MAG: AbrB/MazE/SpoVT family DNA-binding domain-containing protein [Rubrivivax sp.]|jgi:AbrB family looped-hinge helix DNA binding protein|nr:AbrB/MazE/SpoVT family DNA-binding domain-containing protein [Rubrivivax sp.]MBK7264297.1 AbrB/MazE/SpoVT family DNA-binding domain-containing protein [Rubrivivax sp.]MBK8527807.1 AbrB/MazE/SpoVT family DNA-binding domain-containing protein [Rubrivivax sp.]